MGTGGMLTPPLLRSFHMLQRRIRSNWAPIVLGLIFWAATASAHPPGGKIFRFRLPFEPATLDWNKGDVAIPIVQNTMRGLYRVDSNGTVVPDLVESSTLKDEGKKWLFRLKKGIYWSDGAPLHASHAAESIRRLLNPATASSYAYFLFDIENAKQINSGKLPLDRLGVRVVSELELELTLESPIAYLPAILTHWVTYPIRPDLIAKWPDHFTNPAHLSALGSFQISEWRSDLRFVLTPNPHTGAENQAPKPWISRAEGWIISDDNTALNLYETWHLEIMTDPGALPRSGATATYRPGPIAYFIGIGPGHPLTQSRAGILALSAALNRNEIPAILNAPHRPSLELCAPEIWQVLGEKPKDSHLDTVPMDGSATLARKLLRQAGFGKGRKAPPLTLRYFNRPAMKELAEWAQQSWKKVLGIEVKLQGEDVKTYWSELRTKPAPLFLNSKGASYSDPDAYFRLFQKGNPDNLGRWKDPDYERWTQAAAKSTNSSERLLLYKKASRRILVENPGMIPLYFRSTGYLIKPFVKGIEINPLTSVDFSRVSYER